MKKTVIAVLLILVTTFPTYGADIVTKQHAIESALKQVSGKVIGIELDTHKSALVYDLSILDNSEKVHKVSLDAISTTVVKHSESSISSAKAKIINGAKLSYDDAINVVLGKVPVDSQKGSFIKEFELETYNNIAVYDVKLIDNKGIEYEGKVDAVTGNLVSFKQDKVFSKMPAISKVEAEQKAVSSVKGSVIYSKLDSDGGKINYEVMLLSAEAKVYEVKIDGSNGNVIKRK